MSNSHKRTSLCLTPLLVCVLLFLPAAAKAQSVYGQISGRLTKAAGEPLSGSVIRATSVLTNSASEAITDSSGYFHIINLAPDLYEIDVRAEGYKPVHGSAAVSADNVSSINAALQAADSR